MPITIFRSAHQPEEYTDNFKRVFERADIVVIEQAQNKGYDNIKRYYNDLSFYGFSSYPFIRTKEHQKKLISFIKNSKKRVELEKSPFKIYHSETMKVAYGISENSFCTGNLKVACSELLTYVREECSRYENREKSLKKQLKKLQKKNKGKEILLIIGAAHPAIYYDLKNEGLEIRQEFSYKPFVNNLYTELLNRVRINKYITADMTARAIPGDKILKLVREVESSWKMGVKTSREIFERLSYKDIESLSKFLREESIYKKLYTQNIVRWLRDNGGIKGFELYYWLRDRVLKFSFKTTNQ